MREVTVAELTQIIQSVKEAVDDSDLGPIYINDHKDGRPMKIFSPMGFQTFNTVLSEVLSNADKIKIIPKEKPSQFSNN